MRSVAPVRVTPSCWRARGTSGASSSAEARSRGANAPRPRRASGGPPGKEGLGRRGGAVEGATRRMLRARDAMDRAYAQPLDVLTLARLANVSEAHFIRTFRATFGETPHRYLQRRRVQPAMVLLHPTDRSLIASCLVGGLNTLHLLTPLF